jgi:hypothetical protein
MLSSDNICAISMLMSVTGILNAIEYDNAVEIDKCLKGLKSNIESFEKVFYDNLLHRVY